MAAPLLVIIWGWPGTGKTSLGRRLARDLGLPFVNKDGVKEKLFDTLGWKDRAWSKQLSGASNALLFYFAEALLAAGQAVIVESNFDAQAAAPPLRRLQAKYGALLIQIHCQATLETLMQRWKNRAEAGTRHPGHVDAATLEELKQLVLNSPTVRLEIGGEVIEVDTTDFQRLDYGAVRRRVEAAQKTLERKTPAAG
jgi:predicted kinase